MTIMGSARKKVSLGISGKFWRNSLVIGGENVAVRGSNRGCFEFRRSRRRNPQRPREALCHVSRGEICVSSFAATLGETRTLLILQRTHRRYFRDRPDFGAGTSPYFSNSSCNACRNSRL